MEPYDIKDFLLSNLDDHPRDIVAYAQEKLGVTRTTIHRHLNSLIKKQKITRTGVTKQATYHLASQMNRAYQFKVSKDLKEDMIWQNNLESLFKAFPENIQEIVHYGFTEMFNNALEHGFAKHITVTVKSKEKLIQITIADNGVGVFERIKRHFHQSSYRSALLDLTKGKLTTDPQNHTGEGIFFTSRVFDYFYLIANDLCFFRNNEELDWAVESVFDTKGTKIILEISEKSKRRLVDVFEQYTEEFNFTKTDLLVDLSQFEGERLISRSQAKRLFTKLEPFKRVTLDFANVVTVGQGFVDEVFRVYPSKNHQIRIEYINANKDVEFMIKRAL